MHDEKTIRGLRIPARWASAGLAALLSGALLAVWLIPGDPSRAQNRAANEFPHLNGSSVGDPGTYQRVDAALRDRLGAQELAAGVVGSLVADGLGLSPSPSVVISRTGQPFSAEDLVRPCRESEASLLQLRETLGARADEFEAAGKYLLYVVAPDKSSVRRHLVDEVSRDMLRCSDFVRFHFEKWDTDADLPLITLWSDVAAIDEDGSKAYLYNDTHWSPLGATAMTEAVLEQLLADGEAPKDILGDLSAPTEHGEPESFISDLNLVLGVRQHDQRQALGYDRPGVETTGGEVLSPNGVPQFRWISESDSAPLIPGRTLFLGDSFLLGSLTTQLPQFFEDVTFADHHEYSQAGQFDRVIVERVQRYGLTDDWPAVAPR